MGLTIDVVSKTEKLKAVDSVVGGIYSPVGEDRYLMVINATESHSTFKQKIHACNNERYIAFFCLESFGIVLLDADSMVYCQMDDSILTAG